MKIRPIIALGILFLVFTSAKNRAQAVDFSGEWSLDMSKSAFGNIPERAAVKHFEIKQEEDSVTIKRTTTKLTGEEQTTVETISLDGKASIGGLDGGKFRVSKCTWSADRQKLTIVTNYSPGSDPNEIAYTIKQVWELNKRRKELIVSLTTPGYTIKAVYNKNQ